MFNVKTLRVGPFILFRHIGTVGDAIHGQEGYTAREGVVMSKGQKWLKSPDNFDSTDFEITHNSSQIAVRGDFEYYNNLHNKSVVFEEGYGGFRMSPKGSWSMRALSENAIYDCYFPNDKEGRRWARVGGKSKKGDILDIPSKEATQYLIVCIGEVTVNGQTFVGTEEKPSVLKITPNNSRKIIVSQENTVWMRMWPETPGVNLQEKDV